MDKNITSTSGKGKVHKLVRADIYTGEVIAKDYGHPDYGIHAPWCDREHDVDKAEGGGFFLKWTKTDKPITCGTCLRFYWPDGRLRPPKPSKVITELTVDELEADIQREEPRGDGAVIIASSPSKRFAILSIYTDDNKNLCIDVEEV